MAFDPIRKGDPDTDAEIAGWMKKLAPQGVIPEKREAYTSPRVEQIRKAVDNFRAGKVKYETMTAEDYR